MKNRQNSQAKVAPEVRAPLQEWEPYLAWVPGSVKNLAAGMMATTECCVDGAAGRKGRFAAAGSAKQSLSAPAGVGVGLVLSGEKR